MSALSFLRGAAIGVAAVVVPAASLAGTVASVISRNSGVILILLCLTLLLVGSLAWACVHIAHFPPRLAVFLTTFPFGLLLLACIPLRRDASGMGFVICLVPSALAVFIAWWASHRLASRQGGATSPSP